MNIIDRKIWQVVEAILALGIAAGMGVIIGILILLMTGCLPEVRQPDPKCILIEVRWRESHVDQMTELCGTERRTFRPVRP